MVVEAVARPKPNPVVVAATEVKAVVVVGATVVAGAGPPVSPKLNPESEGVAAVTAGVAVGTAVGAAAGAGVDVAADKLKLRGAAADGADVALRPKLKPPPVLAAAVDAGGGAEIK